MAVTTESSEPLNKKLPSLLAFLCVMTSVLSVYYISYESQSQQCHCPRTHVVQRQPPEQSLNQSQTKPEDKRKYYSIISASVPNFGNNTLYFDKKRKPVNNETAWGYIFNIPMTVLAWRRIHVEAIVMLTVDYKNLHHTGSRLLDYIVKVLNHMGVTVLYFNIESEMKVQYSQVLRLMAADVPTLNDDDIVISSDAELWPLDRTRYDLRPGFHVHVTDDDSAPFIIFKRKALSYKYYPVSNIVMAVKTWRETFGSKLKIPKKQKNNYTMKEMDRFRKDVLVFIRDYKITNSSMDDYYASVQVAFYRSQHGLKVFQFEDTKCVRLDTNLEKQYNDQLDKVSSLNCLSDARIYIRKVWVENNWRHIKKLSLKIFNNETVHFLDKYRTVFDSAYNNPKYQIPLDFLSGTSRIM